MMRLFKVLALLSVLVAIGALIMSCGNGGNAQVRVVNAIPDQSQPAGFDIYVNNTKFFPGVASGTIYPSFTPAPPQPYVSIPSGSDSIQVYDSGTTTTNILTGANTATFGGSTQYTLLLAGYLTGSPSPAAYLITDNNTVPNSGDLEIRVINASPHSANNGGGIGLAIYQTGQAPPSTLTNVPFGQSTGYLSFPFQSGISYFVGVHQGGTLLFTYGFTPGGSNTAGSITTLVFVDTFNGSAVSSQPLKLADLN